MIKARFAITATILVDDDTDNQLKPDLSNVEELRRNWEDVDADYLFEYLNSFDNYGTQFRIDQVELVGFSDESGNFKTLKELVDDKFQIELRDKLTKEARARRGEEAKRDE